MKRFVEGEDRRQGVLLPEFLDDYVSDENPVRVIDAFVEALDLEALGFAGVVPEATGRPGYHPGLLLRIYVYGYINQVASSRRLEREAQRNVELMWLRSYATPLTRSLRSRLVLRARTACFGSKFPFAAKPESGQPSNGRAEVLFVKVGR